MLLFAAADARAASGTLTSLSSDGQANSDGTASAATAAYGRLGADAGIRHSVVHVFQIPASILNDPTQRFASATYTLKTGAGSAMTHNGDLYGRPYRTSPAVQAGDFYEGVSDPGSVLIQDNFLTPATPNYSVLATSGGNLADYLNSALEAARLQNASSAYVFLRLNLDSYQWSGIYIIGMTEAGGTYVPKIDYTTETVDAWREVPLGGGGKVTGLMSDPTGSSIYCRTDVGGFFRWVPAADGNNGRWKSISDRMVPFGTVGSEALMGAESLAIDPSNPNRIYVGAGAGTLRGIFLSPDRGETWTQINATISTDANGSFKQVGERCAVDPNNPAIVWYGSGTQGLQRGVLSGTTWTWAPISGTSVPYGTAKAGVTFVLCDRNSGGPTIVYAGVYDAATGGVYRSDDAGTTWSKVGGVAFPTPWRAQMAPDGTLFISGGTNGVAKLPRGGTLALTTGLPALNYIGVAVDPNNANVVYVAENKPKDGAVFRSADGGASWLNQGVTFNEGPLSPFNHARTEPDGTPTVTGYWFGATSSLLVNPANSNELWAADFFGVARTRNAQALGTNPGAWWYMLQKGQEETVVLDTLNAPTGARLMLGVGDVGGYRYQDTNARPGGPGGTMRNPHGGNVTSLDFSEGAPNVWVRSWVEQNQANSPGSGGYSSDGGLSWMVFGQVATRTVANGPADGWESWDVGPYLAKLKARGVNTATLIVSSGNTATYSTNVLSFHSRNALDSSLQPRLSVNGGTPILAEADTFVNGAAKTTNYGSDPTLQVRYSYSSNDANKRWSLLRFNLSSVPAILSAELQLCRIAATNTTVFPVGVYATSNPNWVEGNGSTDNVPANEVVWANAPKPLTNASGDPQGFNYYAGPTRLAGGRIAVSSTDSDRLVWQPIGVGAALHYSNDRGVTWTAAAGGPASEIAGVYTNGGSTKENGQTLAADRGNGYFYAANFGGTAHLIYRSTDGGQNWSQISSVGNNSYNMRTPQLVTAPASPAYPTGGDVWLCDDGSYNGAGGGLWRSVDSAQSWAKLTTVGKVFQVSFGLGQGGVGYSVFIHGYVGSVKGIYRSDDYGTTWVKLADPTIKEILTLTGDRQNHGKVFLGTGGRGTFQWP